MRLILFLCCALLFPRIFAAGLDFQKKSYPVTVTSWRGKNIEAKSFSDKAGLHVTWDAAKSPSAVIGIPVKKVPAIDLCDTVFVTFEIDWDGQTPLKACDLRFQDTSGESFQWRVLIQKMKEPGIYQFKTQLDPKTVRVAFGGNRDKKFDFPIRFRAMIPAVNAKSGNALFTIRRIEWETSKKTGLSNVHFEMETGLAARVLKPGMEKDLAICLKNPGPEALKCRAVFTFRDIRGKTLKKEFPSLELAPHTEKRLTPEIELPSRGIWYVTARLESEDRKEFSEKKRSFSYMIPAERKKEFTPQGDFIFGVCSHSQSIRDPKEVILEAETAALCGIKAVRQDMRWFVFERKKGEWDFSGFDRIIKEFAERGIETMPILSGIPKWEKHANGLSDDAPWQLYAAKVFQRWHKAIRYWEVWNEPDLASAHSKFSAEEYLHLLEITRNVQKEIAPETKLMNGGFGTMLFHGKKKRGFQEYILSNRGDLIDIHALHAHGNFERYVENISLMEAQRRKLGVTIPWFANETAISAYGTGELKQAEILYKKFLYSWANGSIGYNWYDLRNDARSVTNPESHYGLVTRDFYPKAAYPVYNTLARHFRGRKFVRRIEGNPNVYMYEFDSEESKIIASWNAGTEPAGIEVFRTDAEEASEIDMMDNAVPAMFRNGIVLHPVSEEPCALLLKKASRIESFGPLFRIEVLENRSRDHVLKLRVDLFNPMNQKETFCCSFEGMEDIRIEAEAGKRVRRAITLKLPQTAMRLRKIFCRISFAGFSFRIGVLLNRNTVVIPAKHASDEYDFILNSKEQIFSLFEADPESVAKVWTGPDDLSAKIRFISKENRLEIFAEVTDDKHVQKDRGGSIWRGDSLQMAFQVPGQKKLWVLGAALSNGMPELYIWESPEKFNAAETSRKMNLKVDRTGRKTIYRVSIPLDAVGLTPKMLRSGIRFSMIVNDNDGYGREGWAEISKGVSSDRNAEVYPLLKFEE